MRSAVTMRRIVVTSLVAACAASAAFAGQVANESPGGADDIDRAAAVARLARLAEFEGAEREIFVRLVNEGGPLAELHLASAEHDLRWSRQTERASHGDADQHDGLSELEKTQLVWGFDRDEAAAFRRLMDRTGGRTATLRRWLAAKTGGPVLGSSIPAIWGEALQKAYAAEQLSPVELAVCRRVVDLQDGALANEQLLKQLAETVLDEPAESAVLAKFAAALARAQSRSWLTLFMC